MIQNKVEQLLQPVIEEMGYELWACEYRAQGQHSLLRVYIDKEDGISITDCEEVSRRVNAILDVEEPISGHYTLEISSPGIPRPLFHPWQYERYLGREVKLKLLRPIREQRNFNGVIATVCETSVTLEIEGQQQELSFSNIVKANLTDE